MDIKHFHYDTVDSTNRVAREYAAEGNALPALFTADGQTAGRGRLGRDFYSPKNTGLYMTLALPFTAAFENGVALTAAVSVAAHRILAPLTEKKLTVKWVNDILADGKKAAGILCETVADTNGIKAILIGIGINLSTESFPDEIIKTAGSLNIATPDCKKIAEAVSAEILLIQKEDSYKVLEEYKKLSAVIGRDIYYIKNGVRYDAKALDIDGKGGLTVQNSDGTVTTLTSGEITLRIKPE